MIDEPPAGDHSGGARLNNYYSLRGLLSGFFVARRYRVSLYACRINLFEKCALLGLVCYRESCCGTVWLRMWSIKSWLF